MFCSCFPPSIISPMQSWGGPLLSVCVSGAWGIQEHKFAFFLFLLSLLFPQGKRIRLLRIMRRYFHSFKFVKPKKKVEIPLHQWVEANQISLAIPWRGRKGENISNSSSIPEWKRGGNRECHIWLCPPTTTTKATFQWDWRKKKKNSLPPSCVEYTVI